MEVILTILGTVFTVFKYVFYVYTSLIFVVPLVAVVQERKIWSRSPAVPSMNLLAHLKVYIFNVIFMGTGYIGCFLLLPKMIIRGLDDSVERDAHCLVERIDAYACLSAMVGPVVVRGVENLPPENGDVPAPIYIANHSSQIDAGAVYYLFRRFKWIAKKSLLVLPGVGGTMFLGRHIFIDRRRGKNKGSVSKLYAKANESLQKGIPLFIFPQGSRRITERLPFKDGAFNIALENESMLVPVSLHIPLGVWNDWYPINLLWGAKKEPVVLTVHKPVKVTKDMNKEELKQRCTDIIYSVLPKIGETEEEVKEKKQKIEDKKTT
uniref:Phospholipid/glycerol acyltransferase domain-containing protein n=1 Tax=Ditylum brightwellii TaxID=49249 RepID=A0A6V2AFP9_9STRA|mmetsp:Transcript_18077/g.24100  ORF Transcript_18077/g.24100 Transcript_18077/m.24100 type:complete len:322 (-) Transcript_18077:60-1025(-)